MPTVNNAANDTALLVMDLQNERVHPQGKTGASGLAKIVEEAHLLDNVSKVLDAFRQRGWPIATSGWHSGPTMRTRSVSRRGWQNSKKQDWRSEIRGGTEFAEKVAPLPSEIVFLKQSVNPFFNTGLLIWLLSRGVKRLVLCGVATHLVSRAAPALQTMRGLLSTF